MKISKLIKQLQSQMKEVGDIDVVIAAPGKWEEPSLGVWEHHGKKVTRILSLNDTEDEKEKFYTWFKKEHLELHRRWTKDVGTLDYDKDKWRRREKALHDEARQRASVLGISPPYLR